MYRIVEVENNRILCENLKSNKRKWYKKHHIYLKDIPKIRKGAIIDIKRVKNVSPKILKSTYLVIKFKDAH